MKAEGTHINLTGASYSVVEPYSKVRSEINRARHGQGRDALRPAPLLEFHEPHTFREGTTRLVRQDFTREGHPVAIAADQVVSVQPRMVRAEAE